MLLFGDLYGYDSTALSCHFASAAKALIGPFEGFHREDGSFLHDYRLPDFEPRDFFGNGEAKPDIFGFLGRQLGADTNTLRRHDRSEPGSRFDQLDSVLLQFISNRAKDRMGVALLQSH